MVEYLISILGETLIFAFLRFYLLTAFPATLETFQP